MASEMSEAASGERTAREKMKNREQRKRTTKENNEREPRENKAPSEPGDIWGMLIGGACIFMNETSSAFGHGELLFESRVTNCRSNQLWSLDSRIWRRLQNDQK